MLQGKSGGQLLIAPVRMKVWGKWKQHSAVDVWCERKARFCKEQYCIENWNVRSMNQGKFGVVQQEIARMNIDILGISELKWTGTGEINSGHYYIYYCGQESLKRSGVTLIFTKSLQCSIGVKFKNDRMILVCFQGKSFNITAIQINATNTDAEEAEFDQFYEDLGDGQGGLDCCDSWGCKESDTTEQLN